MSYYFLNTISNLSEQIISKLDPSSPQSYALVELLVMGKEQATQWLFIRAHCRGEVCAHKSTARSLGLVQTPALLFNHWKLEEHSESWTASQ